MDIPTNYIDWNGKSVTTEQYEELIMGEMNSDPYKNKNSVESSLSYKALSSGLSGIFGMPYQFSSIVDPPSYTDTGEKDNRLGRKFNEKIFSVMPILFLTPGEPKFMAGYGKTAKKVAAGRLAMLGDGDDSTEFDQGRYYSFESNFNEYKKYANVSLRALAIYMGIGDVTIPVPGATIDCTLKSIDIEDFLNPAFKRLFGTQTTIPFFIDATTSISESFQNSTQQSILAQSVNGKSDNAREIQFIMGSKDSGGLVKNIGKAVLDASQSAASVLGDISEKLAQNTLLNKVANDLTTIVTGGKIVFPEIWSDSDYSRDYSINIKLSSPDPDPVGIFLNIYMPIILLVSMAAPRQVGNSSSSYESPFLVRATYKSIFSCDLGIISSLSISKGGQGKWNIMGHPVTADVSLDLKDLYGSMFISKRMGLICNTAQMDYLATMAGVDMNEYEPTRMIRLASMIYSNTTRDWHDNTWGKIKSKFNRGLSKMAGIYSDTRWIR